MLLFLGQIRNFACKAEGGRPIGKFSWQIGDAKDPEGVLTLTNPNPPIVENLKDDYFTLTEVRFLALRVFSGRVFPKYGFPKHISPIF